MDVVICGAGEVGSHAAETLTADGCSVTLIDTNNDRLRAITDKLDVRVLSGTAAGADTLREAGVEQADLIVGATNIDEVNLVAASIGRAMGARRAVARVHHSAFLKRGEFDYEKHFNIDRLICPEYTTAGAIARALRNPAALAIEDFAGGQIVMHEIIVSAAAHAVGRKLAELTMPKRTRLAAVSRGNDVFLPDANTVLQKGDRVVLVGNTEFFDEARGQFRTEKQQRRNVVLMGGGPMAVWLCKALRERTWSIRLFETHRQRAEELANKLPWVTVLNTDPTDRSVFAEERIGLADVFVGLLDDDEDNIVGAVLAKAGGVSESIAVVQQSRYLDLLYHIGVDNSYSPGTVAAKEIAQLLDDSPIRKLASLAGGLDAYRVRVRSGAPANGHALSRLNLSPEWMLGAIRREDDVWVPGADDVIQAADTVLLIGRKGDLSKIESLFLVK